jgi:hypothetical protein
VSHTLIQPIYLDTFDGAKPRFLNWGKKRRFLRQAQDTESIEVQYQPLPTGRQAEPSAELTPKPYPGLQTGESNGLIMIHPMF